MKVVKNYFWNVSYQLIAIIIPVLVIPYINKVLGPSGVGINSYTFSLAQLFTIIGDLGVANYGTKTIAEVENNVLLRSKIFIEITLMRFFTIIISYSIFLGIVFCQSQYIHFYIFQGIIILASIFDISWFFMGIENFKIVTIRNLIVKFLTVISIFLFVKNRNDLGLYMLIIAISTATGNLSMFVSLNRWVKPVRISFVNLFKHLKYAVIFFIPQIAMQIYQTLNKIILGKIVNVKSVGFFDNSDKVMNILLTLISALSSVMLPHISNIFHSGKLTYVKRCFYLYFNVVLFLSLPMTAGVSALSIKFAPWFFGKSFTIVGPLMMIESLTIFIIGMSLAFSSYFLATNQVWQYNLAIISGAIISLTIGIYLMYVFGLFGAMWSTVITESVITLYEFYIMKKQLEFSKMFKNILVYIFGSTLIFLIVFAMNIMLPFNILMLFLEFIVGTSIYILILYLTKPVILNYLSPMLFKIKNKL